MKKKLLLASLIISAIAGTIIASHISANEQKLLQMDNIEALTDSENPCIEWGHHSELCGYAMVAWNGLMTNCTQLIVVPDLHSHNGYDKRPCPIHG